MNCKPRLTDRKVKGIQLGFFVRCAVVACTLSQDAGAGIGTLGKTRTLTFWAGSRVRSRKADGLCSSSSISAAHTVACNCIHRQLIQYRSPRGDARSAARTFAAALMAINSMCEARVCANLGEHRDRARRMTCPFAVEGPRSSRPVPRPEPSGSFHRSAASARFPTDLSCCPRECVRDTHPKGRDNLLARFMSSPPGRPQINEVNHLFSTDSMLLLCRHIMLRVSWDTIQEPWTKHLVLALR